ncbi:hypothetical protein evm_002465 [Chilo suppressalis]|nr:hypothetical protein evm_002465 [Chilo suppressalis]
MCGCVDTLFRKRGGGPTERDGMQLYLLQVETQNKFLEEISSLTDVGIMTLKKIKKEGSVNVGMWSTPGKKRPHKSTVRFRQF